MKKIFFIVACLLVSSVANAASDEAFRFGWMPLMSTYNVVDPNGPTAPGNGFSYLSGVLIADAGRDARVIGHLIYDKFSLAATTENIAQDVTRMGGNISYQTLLRLTRSWKPWLGAGIGQASETYKNRYRITPGGFSAPLAEPERTANNVFLLINTSTEWEFNKQWDVGFQLQYEHPISDGSRVFRAGIYLIF